MTIHYICRHCRSVIGQIHQDGIEEAQLGFDFLTPEERSDIITYNRNGDTTVKVVCDYCKEALDQHPELSLLSNPLQ